MSVSLTTALKLFAKKKVKDSLKSLKGFAENVNNKAFEGGLSNFNSFLDRFTNLDVSLTPFKSVLNEIKASTTQDSLALMREVQELLKDELVRAGIEGLIKLLGFFTQALVGILGSVNDKLDEFAGIMTIISDADSTPMDKIVAGILGLLKAFGDLSPSVVSLGTNIGTVDGKVVSMNGSLENVDITLDDLIDKFDLLNLSLEKAARTLSGVTGMTPQDPVNFYDNPTDQTTGPYNPGYGGDTIR